MLSRLIIIVSFLIQCTAWGQLPAGWTVNPPSYNYSMTLTGYIIDSCTELSNNNNAVAAFVGGQCRGVAYTDVNGNGRKLAFLTIYSNQVSGEDVQIRLYNGTTTDVKVSLDSVVFQSNAVIGSIAQPFEVTTNHRPYNLQLSNYVVQESTQPGGFIGNFSAQDVDWFQTLQFLLIGDSLDNEDFLISGNQLQLNTVLNFAVQDTYQIFVEVNDGYSCAIQDTFLIVVDDNAFPPVAVNDTVAVNEDELLDIYPILNDTDYDNDLDTSSIEILTNVTNGMATVDSTGRIQYQPNPNYFGMDSLEYVVFDLTNTGPMSDTAWVHITVIPVPDPPVAMNDTTSTDEDVSFTISVLDNDTDVENDIDPGSLTIFVQPTRGTALVANGVIEYTPFDNVYGKDSLAYSICDSTTTGPLCDTAWVYITIVPVPDNPTNILIDTLVMEEDNLPYAYLSLMQTVDEDNPDDSFIYELVEGEGDQDNHHFVIEGNQLILRSKTNYDAKNRYLFRVRTTDEAGLSFEKTFVLAIEDIIGNDIPLPIAGYVSNNQDGKNDYLMIDEVDIYSEFHLIIFDQNGTIVFDQKEGYNNDWDATINGEPLPGGAYYYWFRNDRKEYKGNVTIVN